MPGFDDLPHNLFDVIHKHSDPETRLSLLRVSYKFYSWFIESQLKHVRVQGHQKAVSKSLARLLDDDNFTVIKKNHKRIRTATISISHIIHVCRRFVDFSPPINKEDDLLIQRIVKLTTEATELEFLDLQLDTITIAQDKLFSNMLASTDQWKIETLKISSSPEVTRTCLQKCDPMVLSGVYLLPSPRIPRVYNPSNSPTLVIDDSPKSQQYQDLQTIFPSEAELNGGDQLETRKKVPTLKRLFIWGSCNYAMMADTLTGYFEEVAAISKDFPKLEWLIIAEDSCRCLRVESGTDIPVADSITQLIMDLRKTVLVKLAFHIHPGHQRLRVVLGGQDRIINIRIPGLTECGDWYLALARRIVSLVDGLKEVAFVDKWHTRYGASVWQCRAKQLDDGSIKTELVSSHHYESSGQEFPFGLLDKRA
ncbi:hypothetical protein ACHAPU_007613 [Fusarium lateritium]